MRLKQTRPENPGWISRHVDLWAGLGVALTAFIVYFRTLAPSVQPEDAGELAAVASTLGIAHPTGYPLFTLLGHAFTQLPLGGRDIWKLNLMMALLVSAAIFLFYRAFLIVSRSVSSEGGTRFAAACAALGLAFSRTVWGTAVSVEVYALHMLFLAAVLCVFLNAISRPDNERAWALLAYTLGLSFANHLMTVLVLPAFLYLYFSTLGSGARSWMRIARCIPLFLLGLSPYAYLPIRAQANPAVIWEDVDTLSGLWAHLTVSQYQYAMFKDSALPVSKLGEFVRSLPGEFGYALPLLAALGVALAFRSNRGMLAFILLVFAVSLGFAVNYNFNDPNFNLNSHVAIAMLGAAALGGLSRAAPSSRRGTGLTRAVGAAAALLPLLLNYAVCDRSKDYAVEDYTRNIFRSVDSNAVLFSEDFVYFTSPALYFQNVEKLRPDVVVANLAMQHKKAYRRQLEERHRLPFGAAGTEDDALWAVDPANAGRILMEKTAATRKTYYMADKYASVYARNLMIVPTGMVVRLFSDSITSWPPTMDFAFRPLLPRNPDASTIAGYYADAYVDQGRYRAMTGDTASAVRYMRMALAVKPDVANARELLRSLGADAP